MGAWGLLWHYPITVARICFNLHNLSINRKLKNKRGENREMSNMCMMWQTYNNPYILLFINKKIKNKIKCLEGTE